MTRLNHWQVALWMILIACPFARAQVVIQNPQGGGGAMWRGGAGGPMVNPMGTSLQYLYSPQMEQELELVPEQRESLAKLRTEVIAKMSKLYDTGIADQQERMKKYQESAKALGDETEKKVGEILLPHQMKRIRQIALQMRMQSIGYGGAGAITADDVAQELELSDDQKSKFRDQEKLVQEEIRKKTQEFYKQLQQESRDKLLEVLTPAQKKKLDDLIGEKFEWKAVQPGEARPVRVGQ